MTRIDSPPTSRPALLRVRPGPAAFENEHETEAVSVAVRTATELPVRADFLPAPALVSRRVGPRHPLVAEAPADAVDEFGDRPGAPGSPCRLVIPVAHGLPQMLQAVVLLLDEPGKERAAGSAAQLVAG